MPMPVLLLLIFPWTAKKSNSIKIISYSSILSWRSSENRKELILILILILHSRVFQSNTKVKIKTVFIWWWWYPIQLLLGLIIHAIYKTRAGSILAIDRPEIRTRARCVKSELFGDATAELSILFDWMGAFMKIVLVLSQLILQCIDRCYHQNLLKFCFPENIQKHQD